MAAYFVNSVDGVGGAGDGSSWANAYLTLTLALARPILIGDTLWVGDNHAESTAGLVSLTFPGTAVSPNFVYCVDHTKPAPGTGDLKTTAQVITTGTNNILIAGVGLYCYGVKFVCGTGAGAVSLNIGNTSNNRHVYDNCQLILAATGVSSFIAVNVASLAIWNNTTVKFAGTSQSIAGRGMLLWKNTPNALISGSSIPTTLITASDHIDFLFDGVDLSSVNTTILAANPAAISTLILKDCLLNSSVTIAAETGTPEQTIVDVIRTDSSGAGKTYRVERHDSTADMTVNTAVYRTDGANDGTISFSHQIVAGTSRIMWVQPFVDQPIAIWNNTIGRVTVTVHATTNLSTGSTFPSNDDIWIEISYLGSGSTSQASFATNTKANNLATATEYTTDGTTWVGLPVVGKFSMSVTLDGTTNPDGSPKPTVGQKGYIYVTVKVGNQTHAGTAVTYYVDPLVVLS